MGNIGVSELLLIFLVALLVFGAKRIPEIARGLGQGLREFRKASHEIAAELDLDDLYRPTTIQRPAAPTTPAATPRAAPSPGENQDANTGQPAAQTE